MNEPPIASPFGDANPPHGAPRRSVPMLLKVLVWIELGVSLFNTALVMIRANPLSIAYVPELMLSGVVALISILISLGLLRASKASWWISQGLFVLGFFSATRHLFAVQPHLAPVPFRLLAWLVEIALFITLLTPSMRRFFFTTACQNSM